MVLNWVRNEVLRILVDTGKNISGSPVSPEALAQLLVILDKKEITAPPAKAVIDDMEWSGRSASGIIEEKGLKQISDSSALETMIDKIISNNDVLVKRYKDGDTKLLGFFIGQVMKVSKGQADQAVARDIIIKKLG